MAKRRYGTIVNHLTDDPDTAVELAGKLGDDVLFHLAAAIADEQRRRAVDAGDEDAGRMRAGRHTVEHVVSWEIRRGRLVEVSQRSVKPAGMA